MAGAVSEARLIVLIPRRYLDLGWHEVTAGFVHHQIFDALPLTARVGVQQPFTKNASGDS